MQGDFYSYTITASKAILVLLSVAILIRCLRSMLREKYDLETWAYIRYGKERLPVQHWEVIIGRAPDSDVCIPEREVARTHAVLRRDDLGTWRINDVFSRGGVWVNNIFVDDDGAEVKDGDTLNLNGICVRFTDLSMEKRERLESKRSGVGRRYSPALTLLMLTVFQLFLLLQHSFYADPEYLPDIALAFGSLIVMEWSCFNAMRIINRSGFEIETLAFYLCSLGMSVAASSTPEDLYKQILLTLAGLVLFLLCGWWQRSLHRTASARILVALSALLLLGINVVASDVVLGARNWLEFWGFSFQPSELVKVAYVYVGAATLDRLFRRNNLYVFIAFSAICVMALALIGDFGTALVFFVCFLVISFMRSGSIATIMLAVTGAGLAGFLAVSARPYIAQRFASWGHVWEDIYDKGFQQTRAMSAAAAGGLFGKGAGNGWLKNIFAANTDLVFGVVCEEQGLLIACLMVAAVILLACFAVRSARTGRSAYYGIAACAAMSILLTQVALNVFGSMDILPFTGVTFPFVSRGGSSLLSCWMMMAFLKSADNRREASFAVRPGEKIRSIGDREAIREEREERKAQKKQEKKRRKGAAK
ncbi:MAG: FtsW/RodA/SpoVE family cell cycle protein [Oscillospiraceae bacterium]|nr:FtsW/RodA/SpoVE family cell cycle protein [Oscillospiraceae bacterium]